MRRELFDDIETLVERVYGYVALVVGDGEVAREVTTRTFDFARRHAAAFDPRSDDPAAWLAGIARGILGSRGDAPAAPSDLREIVQALEPAEREVIALHYGAGLEIGAVAGILERSVSEVEAILARAGDDIATALGVLRKEIPAPTVFDEESRHAEPPTGHVPPGRPPDPAG